MIVLIGIPMFGGTCYGDFMLSVFNLTKAFEKNLWKITISLIYSFLTLI